MPSPEGKTPASRHGSAPDRPLEERPVTSLKGVGSGVAARLANLGVHTVQDLLFHLPLRYQDRTRVTPIGQCRLGNDVMLEGEIVRCDLDFGRRRSLLCRIRDETGMIGLRFFHFSAAQKRSLENGSRLRCYGEIRSGKTGYELYHPEYQLLQPGDEQPVDQHLTPVYPATEGLQQLRLRALIEQAFVQLRRDERGLIEWIPPDIRRALNLPSLRDAIEYLHHPPVDASLSQLEEGRHPTQQRLAFEELLAHRLSLRRIRRDAEQFRAPPLPARQKLTARFLEELPFPLTGAQRRVGSEIAEDLAAPRPMLRLLQGDVGSGKTVVAALAALQAVENDCQAVIMAPTELLAEQHYVNFSQWLAPLDIPVGWISGKLKGKKRDEQLALAAGGTTRIIVGTHALFQEAVSFRHLGLVIIDEQHRFGVHQRLALREKGSTGTDVPHQLVMTATPIPRTLAMSAYADLDVSVIDALPPGRTPVNTLLVANERREEVIQRIHNACARGSQAYWVCTLIEESEALQCQAAEATAESLREQLPDVRIGLVHGRMKAAEKTAVMEAFKAGEYQMLVATTVIEVGVDVPDASLMVIENPERLGLAQLHQLRGRIGRGAIASHCVLLYQAPLSQTARLRLAIMRESSDGFHIAERDLEIRGPGQVLGTRQTGLMDFRIADLNRDKALLAPVQQAADTIMQRYPEHVEPLVTRWLGERESYGNV